MYISLFFSFLLFFTQVLYFFFHVFDEVQCTLYYLINFYCILFWFFFFFLIIIYTSLFVFEIDFLCGMKKSRRNVICIVLLPIELEFLSKKLLKEIIVTVISYLALFVVELVFFSASLLWRSAGLSFSEMKLVSPKLKWGSSTLYSLISGAIKWLHTVYLSFLFNGSW